MENIINLRSKKNLTRISSHFFLFLCSKFSRNFLENSSITYFLVKELKKKEILVKKFSIILQICFFFFSKVYYTMFVQKKHREVPRDEFFNHLHYSHTNSFTNLDFGTFLFFFLKFLFNLSKNRKMFIKISRNISHPHSDNKKKKIFYSKNFNQLIQSIKLYSQFIYDKNQRKHEILSKKIDFHLKIGILNPTEVINFSIENDFKFLKNTMEQRFRTIKESISFHFLKKEENFNFATIVLIKKIKILPRNSIKKRSLEFSSEKKQTPPYEKRFLGKISIFNLSRNKTKKFINSFEDHTNIINYTKKKNCISIYSLFSFDFFFLLLQFFNLYFLNFRKRQEIKKKPKFRENLFFYFEQPKEPIFRLFFHDFCGLLYLKKFFGLFLREKIKKIFEVKILRFYLDNFYFFFKAESKIFDFQSEYLKLLRKRFGFPLLCFYKVKYLLLFTFLAEKIITQQNVVIKKFFDSKRKKEETHSKKNRHKIYLIKDMGEEIKRLKSKYICKKKIYDKNFIEIMRKKLNCPIKTFLNKDVVLVKCGHLFSSSLIKDLIKSRNRKCPVCGQDFAMHEIKRVFF